jgi:hypothetical protein
MEIKNLINAAKCCKNNDCVNCPFNTKVYNNECKSILFDGLIETVEALSEMNYEAKLERK